MYRKLNEIEQQSFGQICESLEELVCDLRSYDPLSSLTGVAAHSLVADVDGATGLSTASRLNPCGRRPAR
jgi:hypothetical protein